MQFHGVQYFSYNLDYPRKPIPTLRHLYHRTLYVILIVPITATLYGALNGILL